MIFTSSNEFSFWPLLWEGDQFKTRLPWLHPWAFGITLQKEWDKKTELSFFVMFWILLRCPIHHQFWVNQANNFKCSGTSSYYKKNIHHKCVPFCCCWPKNKRSLHCWRSNGHYFLSWECPPHYCYAQMTRSQIDLLSPKSPSLVVSTLSKEFTM